MYEPYIYYSMIYNSQTMGATQVPILAKFIKKQWSIYTPEHYSAIKKNGTSPFVTTWMDLQVIVLSEISQSKKDKYHMFYLYVKSKQQYKQNRSILIDTENRL